MKSNGNNSVIQSIESEKYPYRLPVFKIESKDIRFSNDVQKKASTIRLVSCDFNTNYYNISFNNNTLRWLRKVNYEMNEIVLEKFPQNINPISPYFDSQQYPTEEWHLCTLKLTPNQYSSTTSLVDEINKRMNESIDSIFQFETITRKGSSGLSPNYDNNLYNSGGVLILDNALTNNTFALADEYVPYFVDGTLIYKVDQQSRFINHPIVRVRSINDVIVLNSTIINPKFQNNSFSGYVNSDSEMFVDNSQLSDMAPNYRNNLLIKGNIIQAETKFDIFNTSHYDPTLTQDLVLEFMDTNTRTESEITRIFNPIRFYDTNTLEISRGLFKTFPEYANITTSWTNFSRNTGNEDLTIRLTFDTLESNTSVKPYNATITSGSTHIFSINCSGTAGAIDYKAYINSGSKIIYDDNYNSSSTIPFYNINHSSDLIVDCQVYYFQNYHLVVFEGIYIRIQNTPSETARIRIQIDSGVIIGNVILYDEFDTELVIIASTNVNITSYHIETMNDMTDMINSQDFELTNTNTAIQNPTSSVNVDDIIYRDQNINTMPGISTQCDLYGGTTTGYIIDNDGRVVEGTGIYYSDGNLLKLYSKYTSTTYIIKTNPEIVLTEGDVFMYKNSKYFKLQRDGMNKIIRPFRNDPLQDSLYASSTQYTILINDAIYANANLIIIGSSDSYSIITLGTKYIGTYADNYISCMNTLLKSSGNVNLGSSSNPHSDIESQLLTSNVSKIFSSDCFQPISNQDYHQLNSTYLAQLDKLAYIPVGSFRKLLTTRYSNNDVYQTRIFCDVCDTNINIIFREPEYAGIIEFEILGLSSKTNIAYNFKCYGYYETSIVLDYGVPYSSNRIFPLIGTGTGGVLDTILSVSFREDVLPLGHITNDVIIKKYINIETFNDLMYKSGMQIPVSEIYSSNITLSESTQESQYYNVDNNLNIQDILFMKSGLHVFDYSEIEKVDPSLIPSAFTTTLGVYNYTTNHFSNYPHKNNYTDSEIKIIEYVDSNLQRTNYQTILASYSTSNNNRINKKVTMISPTTTSNVIKSRTMRYTDTDYIDPNSSVFNGLGTEGNLIDTITSGYTTTLYTTPIVGYEKIGTTYEHMINGIHSFYSDQYSGGFALIFDTHNCSFQINNYNITNVVYHPNHGSQNIENITDDSLYLDKSSSLPFSFPLYRFIGTTSSTLSGIVYKTTYYGKTTQYNNPSTDASNLAMFRIDVTRIKNTSTSSPVSGQKFNVDKYFNPTNDIDNMLSEYIANNRETWLFAIRSLISKSGLVASLTVVDRNNLYLDPELTLQNIFGSYMTHESSIINIYHLTDVDFKLSNHHSNGTNTYVDYVNSELQTYGIQWNESNIGQYIADGSSYTHLSLSLITSSQYDPINLALFDLNLNTLVPNYRIQNDNQNYMNNILGVRTVANAYTPISVPEFTNRYIQKVNYADSYTPGEIAYILVPTNIDPTVSDNVFQKFNISYEEKLQGKIAVRTSQLLKNGTTSITYEQLAVTEEKFLEIPLSVSYIPTIPDNSTGKINFVVELRDMYDNSPLELTFDHFALPTDIPDAISKRDDPLQAYYYIFHVNYMMIDNDDSYRLLNPLLWTDKLGSMFTDIGTNYFPYVIDEEIPAGIIQYNMSNGDYHRYIYGGRYYFIYTTIRVYNSSGWPDFNVTYDPPPTLSLEIVSPPNNKFIYSSVSMVNDLGRSLGLQIELNRPNTQRRLNYKCSYYNHRYALNGVIITNISYPKFNGLDVPDSISFRKKNGTLYADSVSLVQTVSVSGILDPSPRCLNYNSFASASNYFGNSVQGDYTKPIYVTNIIKTYTPNAISVTGYSQGFRNVITFTNTLSLAGADELIGYEFPATLALSVIDLINRIPLVIKNTSAPVNTPIISNLETYQKYISPFYNETITPNVLLNAANEYEPNVKHLASNKLQDLKYTVTGLQNINNQQAYYYVSKRRVNNKHLSSYNYLSDIYNSPVVFKPQEYYAIPLQTYTYDTMLTHYVDFDGNLKPKITVNNNYATNISVNGPEISFDVVINSVSTSITTNNYKCFRINSISGNDVTYDQIYYNEDFNTNIHYSSLELFNTLPNNYYDINGTKYHLYDLSNNPVTSAIVNPGDYKYLNTSLVRGGFNNVDLGSYMLNITITALDVVTKYIGMEDNGKYYDFTEHITLGFNTLTSNPGSYMFYYTQSDMLLRTIIRLTSQFNYSENDFSTTAQYVHLMSSDPFINSVTDNFGITTGDVYSKIRGTLINTYMPTYIQNTSGSGPYIYEDSCYRILEDGYMRKITFDGKSSVNQNNINKSFGDLEGNKLHSATIIFENNLFNVYNNGLKLFTANDIKYHDTGASFNRNGSTGFNLLYTDPFYVLYSNSTLYLESSVTPYLLPFKDTKYFTFDNIPIQNDTATLTFKSNNYRLNVSYTTSNDSIDINNFNITNMNYQKSQEINTYKKSPKIASRILSYSKYKDTNCVQMLSSGENMIDSLGLDRIKNINQFNVSMFDGVTHDSIIGASITIDDIHVAEHMQISPWRNDNSDLRLASSPKPYDAGINYNRISNIPFLYSNGTLSGIIYTKDMLPEFEYHSISTYKITPEIPDAYYLSSELSSILPTRGLDVTKMTYQNPNNYKYILPNTGYTSLNNYITPFGYKNYTFTSNNVTSTEVSDTGSYSSEDGLYYYSTYMNKISNLTENVAITSRQLELSTAEYLGTENINIISKLEHNPEIFNVLTNGSILTLTDKDFRMSKHLTLPNTYNVNIYSGAYTNCKFEVGGNKFKFDNSTLQTLCKTMSITSANITSGQLLNYQGLINDQNVEEVAITEFKPKYNFEMLYDTYYYDVMNGIMNNTNIFNITTSNTEPGLSINTSQQMIPVTTESISSGTQNFLTVTRDPNFSDGAETFKLPKIITFNKGFYGTTSDRYKTNEYKELITAVNDYYYNFMIDEHDVWDKMGFNVQMINNEDIYNDIYLIKGKYYSEQLYIGPILTTHDYNFSEIERITNNNKVTNKVRRTNIKNNTDIRTIPQTIRDKYFNKKTHQADRMPNLSIPTSIEIKTTQNKDIEKYLNNSKQTDNTSGSVGTYNVIRPNDPAYVNIQQSININDTIRVPENSTMYIYLTSPNQKYPIINSSAVINVEYIK